MSARLLLALLVFWSVSARAQNQAVIFPQLGHSGGIHAIAYSPDGRYLASGASDKMIRLWDVKSGREVRTLVGTSDVVSAVVFSPDGKLLATGDWDKTVTVWDVASGRALLTLGGGTGVVWSLAFSPDGKFLASGSSNRIPSDVVEEDPETRAHNIELWDVANGAKRVLYKGLPNVTASLAFSRDSRRLVAGGADGMRWWDVKSGRLVRTLAGKTDDFASLAFSPNGKILATGGTNGVVLWNAVNARVLRKFKGTYEEVTSLAFSPDGKALATGTYEQSVTVWDVSRGKLTRTIVEGHDINGTHVAFSPDGKALASVSDKTIALWDAASGKALGTFGRRTAYVESVAFSPDGKLLASGSDDKTIKIWDPASGRELRVLKGHGDTVYPVRFSPDGSLLASGSADNLIALWDAASGKPLRVLEGHTSAVTSLAFSPDGTRLAAVDTMDAFKVWDAKTGHEVLKIALSDAAQAVAYSPDGKNLVTVGAWNGDVDVWDADTGAKLRTFSGDNSQAMSVAFSPDGTLLATGSMDHKITLWDFASGKALHILEGHGDWIESVAFSPDGTLLASGSSDGTVRVWDAASGRALRTLEGHLGIVTAIAFSPDGTTLASSSWDGTTRVWDVASGKERAALMEFDDGSSIAVTPDGFFSSSSEAAEENLNVRIGGRVFGISSFREHFYRPDLVKLGLAGEPLQQFGSIDAVKLSPAVELVDLPATTTKSNLTLNLRLTDGGGGFGPVRLFWNGTIIKQDNAVAASGAAFTRSYTVPLFPGANALRISALNADGTMFSDATASVTANLPAPAKLAGAHATLHAVVVGIAHFPNAPANDLSYPGADAALIAQTLGAKAGPLFDRLDIRLLKPEEGDRAHVVAALQAMQAAAGPDDEFVFYVASHGIVVGGEYYVMTADAASPDPASLKQHAISSRELSDLMANIKATKKLVIIDTCDAGEAVKQSSGGLAARDAVTILGRSFGLTVLAATTSNQDAIEGGYRDHGLFTWVVNDGLSGKAADAASGVVSSFLLADYVNAQVPVLANTILHRTQQPTAEKSGQAFAITKVK